MSDSDPSVTEEEARRLWQRAAELQAEAAQRLEERSRQLAPRDDSDATGPGYQLADVRAAAVGAGISPEFVDQALNEADSGGGLTVAPKRSAITRAAMGNVPHVLQVSRVFDRSAEEIYAALKRILPLPPYSLNLVDTRGQDPLEGAALVFDVPKMTGQAGGGDMSFAYDMAWGSVKQLEITLQRIPTEPPSCEVTIRAPLTTMNSNGYGLAMGAFVGGGAGGVAALIVASSVAAAALPLIPGLLVIAGAGGAVGGLGLFGLRKVVKYSLGRPRGALERLQGAIAGDIQTDGGFSRRQLWPDEGQGRPGLPAPDSSSEG